MQKLHDFEESERFMESTPLANLRYIGNQYLLPFSARMISQIFSVHRLGFHYANHISGHDRGGSDFQQQLHKII